MILLVEFLIYEESIIYSPRSGQCLPGAMKQFNTPLHSIITVVSPMPFDTLLLALTVIKAFKSATLLDSHPTSPIVCVVFHFDLSSKLIQLS